MEALARQGISYMVCSTRLVYNAKLETNELRKELLLLWRMQLLVSKLDKALLISKNGEFSML